MLFPILITDSLRQQVDEVNVTDAASAVLLAQGDEDVDHALHAVLRMEANTFCGCFFCASVRCSSSRRSGGRLLAMT